MRIVVLIIALECVSLSVNAQNSNKRPDTYNYNRGLEELRKENYEEALTYLNKEVESNPKNGYAYSWIAMIRHAQEEYGRALTSVDVALKYLPQNTYSGAYPFSVPGLQSAVGRAKIGSF